MCFLYRENVSGIQLALDPNGVEERRKKKTQATQICSESEFHDLTKNKVQ